MKILLDQGVNISKWSTPPSPNGQEFLVQSCHPILADALSSSQNILRVKLHGAIKRKSSAINTDHFYTTRSVLPSCNSEYPEMLHTLTISTFRSGNNINLKLKLNLMNPILTVLHSCLYLWQLCVQWKRPELQEPSIVIYWMLHHQPGLRICAAQNWLQKAKERQKCKTNWSLIPGAEKSYLSINNQCFLRPPVLSRYFTWTGSIQ